MFGQNLLPVLLFIHILFIVHSIPRAGNQLVKILWPMEMRWGGGGVGGGGGGGQAPSTSVATTVPCQVFIPVFIRVLFSCARAGKIDMSLAFIHDGMGSATIIRYCIGLWRGDHINSYIWLSVGDKVW